MKKNLFSFLVLTLFILTSWMQPTVPKEIMDRGKVVYDKTCLSCHMTKGEGVPRIAPSLVRSQFVLGSKTKLIRIALRGSDEFPPNEDRDFTNPMAPIENLSDQQMADVLTFVRNSFSNKGTIITAGDVRYVKARM